MPLCSGTSSDTFVMCLCWFRVCLLSLHPGSRYPTSVRNFGLGLNNAFSRIGGLLAPFAVQARNVSWYHTPEAIFAALSVLAAGLVFLLPHDKKGACTAGCCRRGYGCVPPAFFPLLVSASVQDQTSCGIPHVHCEE